MVVNLERFSTCRYDTDKSFTIVVIRQRDTQNALEYPHSFSTCRFHDDFVAISKTISFRLNVLSFVTQLPH